MSQEPTKYEISSFEQLCNIVNDENVQNLATDLALWLLQYNYLLTAVKKENPEATKGKTNWEIAQGSFNWINDGKNDFIGFQTKVNETGETRFYKFPNKSD